MARIQLIHAKPSDARDRVTALRKAGHTVSCAAVTPELLQRLRSRPPDAVLIDLSRQPSLGRDVAMDLRHRKATRDVPIVFVDGDPNKLPRIRKQIPDARYTSWRRVRGAIANTLKAKPAPVVIPTSPMAGYSGTPLPKKLGIKAEMVVALVGAPKSFETILDPVPPNVTFRRSARGRRDLTIWFVTKSKVLSGRIKAMAGAVGDGGLWIAWPKKASGMPTNITQNDVRRTGLDNGLVDYKICAIDDTWSGLKFSRRKS